MVGTNGELAIIPADSFQWRPRVRFIESFRTRSSAIDYAFQYGYNLIVERKEGSFALFDVMLDPDGSCTVDLNLELLKTEEVLVEPYTGGWTALMLWSAWEFARRWAIAVRDLWVTGIVPLLRQAASRRRRAAIKLAMRDAWRRVTRPSSAGVYSPSWRSFISAGGIRVYSLSAARLHARRMAAGTAAFYRQEIVPFYRSTASRCWWSNPAVALRRGWHRNSQGSVSDIARRLAAEASVLYVRDVMPRLRYALSRRCQVDIHCACRRAWRIAVLKTLRLAEQFATAVGTFHVRHLAPRLRQAAAHYQQADFEGTLRRSIEAVTPPQQSNSSQLG
jgi:hypothetical protein